MRIRLIRSHDCPGCCFRNEFPEGSYEQGQPEPYIDRSEVEVCPGCKALVPVSTVLRLAADPTQAHLLAH